jgi:hypothetical protein
MISREVDIDRFNGLVERLVFASSRYTLSGTQRGVAASTRSAYGIARPPHGQTCALTLDQSYALHALENRADPANA